MFVMKQEDRSAESAEYIIGWNDVIAGEFVVVVSMLKLSNALIMTNYLNGGQMKEDDFNALVLYEHK